MTNHSPTTEGKQPAKGKAKDAATEAKHNEARERKRERDRLNKQRKRDEAKQREHEAAQAEANEAAQKAVVDEAAPPAPPVELPVIQPAPEPGSNFINDETIAMMREDAAAEERAAATVAADEAAEAAGLTQPEPDPSDPVLVGPVPASLPEPIETEPVKLASALTDSTPPAEREKQATLEAVLAYFAVDARAAERARIGMLGTRALKNILEQYRTHLGEPGTNRAAALVAHYLAVLNDPATVHARRIFEDSGNSYTRMAQEVARAIGSDVLTNRLTQDNFVERARDAVRDNAVLKSAILALEPHLARYLGKGESIEFPCEVPASLVTLLGILQHAVPHLNALRDREGGLRERLVEVEEALDRRTTALHEERAAAALAATRLRQQVVATADTTTLVYDRRARLFLSHAWISGSATVHGRRRLPLRHFAWTADATQALKLPDRESALRLIDGCLAKRKPNGAPLEPELFGTPIAHIGLATTAYYLPELEG